WPIRPNFPGALRFSADGKTLAFADAGSTLRLFHVADGAERISAQGNFAANFLTLFAPDGRTAITPDTIDATLRWWDAAGGKLLGTQEWPATQVGISAAPDDCKPLFSWGSDQPVRTWDLDTGKPIRTWATNFGIDYPYALVPSPDGKTIALLYQRPTLVLADTATGRELRRLEAHTPYANGARFLSDSKTFVTWGPDGRVRLWDVGTGHEVRQITVSDRRGPPAMRAPGAVQAPGIFFHVTISRDDRFLAVTQKG